MIISPPTKKNIGRDPPEERDDQFLGHDLDLVLKNPNASRSKKKSFEKKTNRQRFYVRWKKSQ